MHLPFASLCLLYSDRPHCLRHIGKTFPKDGKPPLGAGNWSTFGSAIHALKDRRAPTVTQKDFKISEIDAIQVTGLWEDWCNMRSYEYHSEADIAGYIVRVLMSAVRALKMETKLKLAMEVNVYELRPDIYALTVCGFPIGVCEEVNRILSLHLGCTDRLLTTCYNSDSDKIAQEEADCNYNRPEDVLDNHKAIQFIGHDEEEDKEDIFVPDRQEEDVAMYGSDIYTWDSPKLPNLLMTTILKMYKSPYDATLLDPEKRMFLVLNKEHYYWTSSPFRSKKRLSDVTYGAIPQKDTETLILLEDLRYGLEGRVWAACSLGGVGCVIKFIRRTKDGEIVLQEKIQEEADMWWKANEMRARVVQLGGRSAVMMPRVKRYQNWKAAETPALVRELVKDVVTKKRKTHTDAKQNNVGLVSPFQISKSQKTPVLRFIDAGSFKDLADDADLKAEEDRLYNALMQDKENCLNDGQQTGRISLPAVKKMLLDNVQFLAILQIGNSIVLRLDTNHFSATKRGLSPNSPNLSFYSSQQGVNSPPPMDSGTPRHSSLPLSTCAQMSRRIAIVPQFAYISFATFFSGLPTGLQSSKLSVGQQWLSSP
ncbi:hypothetical protein PROFUN_16346 [Planoprotostelium fungivorum]|uniref:DUF5898 domain-containing protein n=1 Tax=Planoprotostelium fungivorum TaxID=1890364 RepID=A0A2P6MQL4_9EUKA|nr:hypothetical protein PROFUN_16346 [Planoprotostelium fungivorum]